MPDEVIKIKTVHGVRYFRDMSKYGICKICGKMITKKCFNCGTNMQDKRRTLCEDCSINKIFLEV